ncbi:MAG: glycosyltransferase [Sphingomonas bacterium]|uniref:glycosyltransferase family 4 protein n=1 Tax=Sphingomonas bacterium TaxID=1895847 RepID=UPI0026370E07|nr:glycosyltransferase family 4 protein [Sphingomonas bacterium]MDB5696451.1 glycosyltransferase [Sphingomonas bacterium]
MKRTGRGDTGIPTRARQWASASASDRLGPAGESTGSGDAALSLRFAFVSSNFSWGGSETLWSETAAELARRGCTVTAYKNRLARRDGNVATLEALKVKRRELARFPGLPNQLFSLVGRISPYFSHGYQALRLHASFAVSRRHDLIVLSQGGNADGWLLGAVCRRGRAPYVVISQKATDLYWPQDDWQTQLRSLYRGARHSFFVSHHNRVLTEEQIGERIPRASVVRNPFLVPPEAPIPWPADGAEVRLACVGRLYPKEKGQDLLLRVLARKKWRDRPLSVTFFGEGEQRAGLESMARLLGLDRVRFAGFTSDVAAIWADHHGLVLPSRAEGLPLVLVEAMMAGRVAVVTDVGGNAEVIDDGRTGFIADAPTEASFDRALERAWERRGEWRGIGTAAAAEIRTLVPPDPAADLADRLMALATERDSAGVAA